MTLDVAIADQRQATMFYVMGLGLTRDPYLMTGVDNMWINAGSTQFHLPTGKPQVLRGTIGMVMPDLPALRDRLEALRSRLTETRFGFDATDDTVELTCPWGNRFRCHAPDAGRFGRVNLGVVYVEIDAAPGSSPGIARFYREILANPAGTGQDL